MLEQILAAPETLAGVLVALPVTVLGAVWYVRRVRRQDGAVR